MPFYGVEKSDMISACENTDVCGTRIASQASIRAQRYKASSVIRRPASSVYIGGGKNCLRSLWLIRASLVRPQVAPSPGLGVWRPSDLLGGRDPAYRLQEMRQGEAGEAGLARGQSVLQQTLRLLRGTALPSRDYQGHCQRNASIRQVPRFASPWRSLGHGTQKRVCPADGQRQALYQGSEAYAAISARNPHD